jgi:choline kinase
MQTNKNYIARIKLDKQPENGENLSIIIPCARCGKNLRKQGLKSLFNIGDTTIIETQINLLNKIYPENEIILVLGEEAYRVKNLLKNKYKNVRYIYNSCYENHNVLYSIGLGLYNRLRNSALIIYGDLIFNKYTITDIIEGPSKLFTDTDNTMKDSEPGIIMIDGKIQRLVYGIRPKWGQICFLVDKELKLFEKCALKNPNWCGHEAINYVMENGGIFQPFVKSGYKLFEIDTLQDIEILKRMK